MNRCADCGVPVVRDAAPGLRTASGLEAGPDYRPEAVETRPAAHPWASPEVGPPPSEAAARGDGEPDSLRGEAPPSIVKAGFRGLGSLIGRVPGHTSPADETTESGVERETRSWPTFLKTQVVEGRVGSEVDCSAEEAPSLGLAVAALFVTLLPSILLLAPLVATWIVILIVLNFILGKMSGGMFRLPRPRLPRLGLLGGRGPRSLCVRRWIVITDDETWIECMLRGSLTGAAIRVGDVQRVTGRIDKHGVMRVSLVQNLATGAKSTGNTPLPVRIAEWGPWLLLAAVALMILQFHGR
jgi:hypothetical protein